MNTKGTSCAPIDLVITWVDGGDEKWRKTKAAYTSIHSQSDDSDTNQSCKSDGTAEDDDEVRYRDWGLLPYWFRGAEQCLPWVRYIYFVTQGHLPPWLNQNHPQLKIVPHEAFIPSAYLPTFNSHTIELNMHRLPGLSEQFVYFNDDMFPLRLMKPETFFIKGLPRDMLALQPVVANPGNPVMSHIYLNNSLVLSRYFQKRNNMVKQPGHYWKFGYPPLYFFYNVLEIAFPLFTGFYTVHGPSPFLKQTFETLWEKEYDLLHQTCLHRLRSSLDVSPYLLREWQKLTGQFIPGNTRKDTAYYNLTDNDQKLYRNIVRHSSNMICINDGPGVHDFETGKSRLHQAFKARFPRQSSYERGTT
jgi:hypothetical protein